MPVSPYHGEFPERSVLTDEERAAMRDEPRIHPFNQGTWPSDEDIAARQEQVREQMRRMKIKNPKLYKRLPLLHED